MSDIQFIPLEGPGVANPVGIILVADSPVTLGITKPAGTLALKTVAPSGVWVSTGSGWTAL